MPTHGIEPACTQPDEQYIYLLQCDGASRGNPGWSGCGGAIWRPDEYGDTDESRIAQYQLFFEHATNNVAEYEALVRGLALALGLDIRNISVQMHSKLTLWQSCGNWQAKHPLLAWYRDFAQAPLHQFDW